MFRVFDLNCACIQKCLCCWYFVRKKCFHFHFFFEKCILNLDKKKNKQKQKKVRDWKLGIKTETVCYGFEVFSFSVLFFTFRLCLQLTKIPAAPSSSNNNTSFWKKNCFFKWKQQQLSNKFSTIVAIWLQTRQIR